MSEYPGKDPDKIKRLLATGAGMVRDLLDNGVSVSDKDMATGFIRAVEHLTAEIKGLRRDLKSLEKALNKNTDAVDENTDTFEEE